MKHLVTAVILAGGRAYFDDIEDVADALAEMNEDNMQWITGQRAYNDFCIEVMQRYLVHDSVFLAYKNGIYFGADYKPIQGYTDYRFKWTYGTSAPDEVSMEDIYPYKHTKFNY